MRTKDHFEQAVAARKILRVFKLINLLSTRELAIQRIASEMEMSQRTIFRYIYLLEEVGFKVVHRHGVRGATYTISTDSLPKFMHEFLKVETA